MDRIAIAPESVKLAVDSTQPLLAIGHFSERLIEVLACHFVVIRVPESGSSQACAHCRQRLEFASKRQLRTKVCPNSRCVRHGQVCVGVPVVRATWPASNVAALGVAFFLLVLVLLLTRLQLVTILCFLSTRVSVCVLVCSGGLVVLLFVEKLFTALLKENYSLTFGGPSLESLTI